MGQSRPKRAESRCGHSGAEQPDNTGIAAAVDTARDRGLVLEEGPDDEILFAAIMAIVAELWAICVNIYTAANYFLAAMFGAFVLYMLNRLNNRQPFSLFSAIQLKIESRPFLIFLDMLVSSAIGAGVVVLVITLGSAREATAAGLGLTGLLSAFGKDA